MSIQTEISNDPVLRDWMAWPLDSKHFQNQLDLKFAAVRIALDRSLEKKVRYNLRVK